MKENTTSKQSAVIEWRWSIWSELISAATKEIIIVTRAGKA